MKKLSLAFALLFLNCAAYAADGCIPSGTTDQYTYFVAVDSTDFTTRETGISSWTVYRSRDGGTAAAFTTPTINETDTTNMPGVYELLLDEDMTIGTGNDVEYMALHITATGVAPISKEICIARSKITAGNTLTADSNGRVDVSAVGGTSQTANDNGADINSILANIGTPTDLGGGATLADNASDMAGATFSTSTDSQEAIRDRGDAAWTTGSGGCAIAGGCVASGTAQSVTATTIQLASAETFADDELNGATVVVTGGTLGVGQSRLITDYVSSTDTATVDTWTTTPTGTITYSVIGTPPGPSSGSPAAVVAWNGTLLATTNPLPNAAADGAGGLPVSDAGALDLDAEFAKLGTPTDFGSGTSTLAANLQDLADDGTATYDRSTDSQQALRDRGDAAWTTGSGTGLTALATGTAQGGTSTTIQLAAAATFADDEMNWNVVKLTGGTGAGQARLVNDYVGATDTATIYPAWATTPDATSTYEIVEGSAMIAAWNAVSLGTTNPLPNAAADGAGGLIISDAGGLDADAQAASVSAIETDTAEIGTAGAGLTNINLPDQTMNITGNVTGNLSGSVGTVGSLPQLEQIDDAILNCEVNTANFAGSTTTLACILTDSAANPITIASNDLEGRELYILSGTDIYEGRFITDSTWDGVNSEAQLTLSRALPNTQADAVTAIIR